MKNSGYVNQIVSIKDLKFSSYDSKLLVTNKEIWSEVFKIRPEKLFKFDGKLSIGKNEESISGDNEYCDNFYSIGKYIPVRYIKNANKKDTEFSKNILANKDLIIASIRFFCKIFENLINENGKFIISTIPSSTVDNVNGVDLIAHILSLKNEGVIDGSPICAIQEKGNSWKAFPDHSKSILRRITSLPKKSKGGPRDFKMEYDSLIINQLWKNKIKDRLILLIDDVITSGTSMETCQSILLQAGARRVICLALGRTQ